MKKNVAENNIVQNRVVPASDIVEQEEGFRILLDVPGVTKDSISIEMEENELTISCHCSRKDEGRKFIHREFGEVEYLRTFTLTDMVDREKISASFSNGVLELFLPRAETTKPRRINIS